MGEEGRRKKKVEGQQQPRIQRFRIPLRRKSSSR
jgi:hypothetical protein